jgi:hypothetical protein
MMIVTNFEFADNGVCTHTRGDTAQFSMEVQMDGAVIKEWQGTFSVKQYLDDDNYLYKIPFNQATPCIIPHSATQDMPYGNYWYDIQIIFNYDGKTVYRTIGANPYILKPDVTG